MWGENFRTEGGSMFRKDLGDGSLKWIEPRLNTAKFEYIQPSKMVTWKSHMTITWWSHDDDHMIKHVKWHGRVPSRKATNIAKLDEIHISKDVEYVQFSIIFRSFSTFWRSNKSGTQEGFQIDSLRLASDWLILKRRQFDWQRAPSNKHQFENLQLVS